MTIRKALLYKISRRFFPSHFNLKKLLNIFLIKSTLIDISNNLKTILTCCYTYFLIKLSFIENLSFYHVIECWVRDWVEFNFFKKRFPFGTFKTHFRFSRMNKFYMAQLKWWLRLGLTNDFCYIYNFLYLKLGMS